MKKHFLILFFALLTTANFYAQAKGTKIGYIDMEYILQKVPDYIEAQNQLELKAQKWKQEIEVQKMVVNKLREALKIEKPLLTKGLIEERESEINLKETEMLDYQQKRFGASGDLIIMKTGLTKPIQDQVFTAVQDIAEAKKYDFILDKTSDLTLLFAAKRLDISDQVVRLLNRTDKREQLSKKQQKLLDAKEANEDVVDQSATLQDRKKALETKKAARDAAMAERLLLQEERKQKILDEREAKKSGIAVPITTKTVADKTTEVSDATDAKQKAIDERALAIENRKKAIEENKKAQDEKRQQILADRAAKKTGTVSESNLKESEKISKTSSTTTKDVTVKAETKSKETVAEERKLSVEERKKTLEERKKKILEERAAMKKAAEEKAKQ